MIDFSKLEDFRKRFIPERLTLSVAAAFSLFVLCIYLFAVVAESWMDQELLYQVDRNVHTLVGDYLQPRHFAIAQAITYFADILVAIAISLGLVVFFYWKKWWSDLAALALAMGGGQALAYTLKLIFARARPRGPLTEALTVAESFPSGHTFTGTVLYGFLLVLAWRHFTSASARIGATAACVLLIVAIGFSRILLSVHWTSDVLGGWLVGLAWLLCSLQIVSLSRRS